MSHGKRNPTIQDVAHKAGVGLMTVSRVVNDSASVRPSTRKRVLAAITELGYKQNEAARLLKGQRSKTIGLIVPDLSDVFFAACAHTIQHVARSKGYMTLVVASERDPDLEIQQAELMASRKVAGLLVVTSVKDDHRIKALQNDGLSIVAFDRPLSGIDTDAVVVENKLGAEEAVRHLIGHGHTRIACIGYDQDAYTIRERLDGYMNSMRADGLKPLVSPIVETLDATRFWLEKILKTEDHPTAFFSLNHRTSTYLLQLLPAMHFRVPKDIALIGFDDFELAHIVAPPLTTVAQSPVEIAQRASALLFERIANGDKTGFPPVKVALPVKLIIRTSCGCGS
jgi:LacI family transcriptional regulator